MSAKAALAAIQDPKNRVESTVAIPEGTTAAGVLKITAAATGQTSPTCRRSRRTTPPSACRSRRRTSRAGCSRRPTRSSRASRPADAADDGHRAKKALDDAGVPVAKRQRTLTLAASSRRRGTGRTTRRSRACSSTGSRRGCRCSPTRRSATARADDRRADEGSSTRDENGYNTYLHKGLPVGPISNPGDAAIKAALHPAKGTWLYFVTVNLATGKTVFSNTLAEHDKAAARVHALAQGAPELQEVSGRLAVLGSPIAHSRSRCCTPRRPRCSGSTGGTAGSRRRRRRCRRSWPGSGPSGSGCR